jgi:predicted dehydrogenase
MTQKLKVGLVGLGGLGRGLRYGLLFNSHPKTKVTAICDIDEMALDSAKRSLGLSDSQCFKNYEDFIKSDVDIVFIGTPGHEHAWQSILALESGKHVLCELMPANSEKDCESLYHAVRKSGMKYMMAENYSYFHYIMQWKQIIMNGELGKIFYAESEYVHEIRSLLQDPNTGKLLWRANRPPIHYIGHCLTPLLLLMEDRVTRVTAWGRYYNIMQNVGPGAIDMQVALFETKKGAAIKVLRSQVAPREPPLVYYSIYGTKGCLENGRFDHPYQDDVTKGIRFIEGRDKVAKKIPWKISNPRAPKNAKIGGHGTSEYYLVKDFVNSIEKDVDPPINIDLSINVTLAGLKAHEVAESENKWVTVPNL